MPNYNLSIPEGNESQILNFLKQYKGVVVTPVKPYEDEVLENVRKGVEEMNLIRKEVLEGIPARSILDEL